MCLYELCTDPSECNNLIHCAPHAPVRKDLRRRLLQRMMAIGEPPAKIVAATGSQTSTQRTVDYPNERGASALPTQTSPAKDPYVPQKVR